MARNSTFVTPTLSLADTSTVAFPFRVAPFADGTMTAVVGAVRSTLTVMGALVVLLPAASNATLLIVYVPCATGSVFQV